MMKAKKTLTMISAADVMTRPVLATPSMTALRVVVGGAPRLSLNMWVIRKTS